MFMLFEPVQIPGDLLITGATRDPTALQAIWIHERALDRVLVLDPIADAAWRMPRGAYDAFQLMLMNPIAALQELMLGWYAIAAQGLKGAGGQLPELQRIPLLDKIADKDYPTIWQWTHDNAMKLQQIGLEAARPVARLVARDDFEALAEFNYSAFLNTAASQARTRQFLRTFAPLREEIRRFVPRRRERA
jgi:hypothetical protein